MVSNILDPAALVAELSKLLPPDARVLNTPHDAIAALSHAILTLLAFRLISVDSSTTSSLSENVLPSEWNRNGPGHYTFKYRHDQSSLQFVIKVSEMGTRTLFNAIAVESDKIASLDIATKDFTSPSFYPYNLDSPNGQSLVHGFISSNRVSDFVAQFKLKIIQKLIPGLQKEGYTEDVEASNDAPSTSRQPPPTQPNPQAPPYAPDRDLYRPPSAFPRNPLEIGRRDLDPFPRNPFSPPSLFPDVGGDGMFVGPDHPIFGGRDRGGFADRGPWGGDGFLPPIGAPPGARFDPVGPDSMPGRGGFGPLRGRGRGGPPGGGNMRGPDNDEFMPPGFGDMYM
ncbi:PI31 proteasome regulator N-terminal-domain-containing protein [Crucibulum laeve]|uniref:PI31 proteasome regulator N-terminal-domain-containing protein n=1 Tax=Crucibulum laeve TaxID=68775 RepID=A0A5C3MFH1_9AGAR|nr:PI31 proteasome regulator N-terminal-domain-containing protein [Crucibulum laeve]